MAVQETTESKSAEEVEVEVEEVVVKSTPSLSEKKKKKYSPPVVKKKGSFREESNVVGDLQEYQKKALDDLKSLLRSNQFFSSPCKPQQKKKKKEEEVSPVSEEEEENPTNADNNDGDGAKTVEAIESTVIPVASPPPPPEAEDVQEVDEKVSISIWGVPLLEDSRSDTVLLKFLRAREFKAKDAMAMINNTILWRKREFGTEEEEENHLVLDDINNNPEFHKVVFMDGVDKEGHPVCYNIYGELFQNNNKEAFGDDEEEKKRKRFLRWRILFLEKGIRELLDFSPTGISTMVQVTDLRNSSLSLLKAELHHALYLLQDNYPEFVAKQVH